MLACPKLSLQYALVCVFRDPYRVYIMFAHKIIMNKNKKIVYTCNDTKKKANSAK